MENHQLVLVLDFGGQYNQLIARRVREHNVYCEVKPYTRPRLRRSRRSHPIGIIFTGGPNSVYEEMSPKCDPDVFELGVPVLGICYGCQLMAHTLGGRGNRSTGGHRPRVRQDRDLSTTPDCKLFKGLPEQGISWMSHGDYMAKVPEGFELVAHTDACPTAAIADEKPRLLRRTVSSGGEPHRERFSSMLKNFLYEVCHAKGDWTMGDSARTAPSRPSARQVGDGKVLLALSGGVDSSVAAALLAEAVGNQLTCVFVDHGLMRKNEGDEVEAAFCQVGHQPDPHERGRGVPRRSQGSDRSGATSARPSVQQFIRTFEKMGKQIGEQVGKIDYLAQGTIYPDVIESGTGDAAVIKSHHNVGGLPDYCGLQGDHRAAAHAVQGRGSCSWARSWVCPSIWFMRQPFPGPGLAIRIIGEMTKEKLDILREADAIFREEIAKAGLDEQMQPVFRSPDQYAHRRRYGRRPHL